MKFDRAGGRGRALARMGGAVVDQALFAGASFVVSFGLARWLHPREYGIFAVAYTVYLLLAMLHTGVVTEPMVVFGSGRFKQQWARYLYIVLVSLHLKTVAMGSGAFLLVALLCWARGLPAVGTTYVSLAVTAPFTLLMLVLRRGLYVQGQPWQAAVGSASYTMLVAVGLPVLRAIGRLDPGMVFGVMGAAALVVFWTFVAMGKLPIDTMPARGLVAEAGREHLRYGRWAVGAGLLAWIPANIFYLILPLAYGLEATATLRALFNFAMPVLQAASAVGYLLISRLARMQKLIDISRVVRVSLQLITLGALVYTVAVAMVARDLFAVTYDGRYVEHANLLWIVLLACVPASASAVMAGALKALERPDLSFRCYAAAATAAVTAGSGLALTAGVAGAAWGLLVAHTAGALAALVQWRRVATRLGNGEAVGSCIVR